MSQDIKYIKHLIPVLLLCTLVERCSAIPTLCAPGETNRNGRCGRNAAQSDSPGACPYGSSPKPNNGSQMCVCDKGFRLCLPKNCTSGQPYCKDVDECKASKSKCGPNAACVNTVGRHCCWYEKQSQNDRKHECSGCEKECYIHKNATKSSVSEQMCLNSCQMKDFYDKMYRPFKKVSDENNKVARILDNAERALRSLIEVPWNQSEERNSLAEFEIVIRRHMNPAEPIKVSALGNSMEVDPALFTDPVSGARSRNPTIAFIVHKNMTTFLDNNTVVREKIPAAPEQKTEVLNSAIITAVITSKTRDFPTRPINFTFSHIRANVNNSIIRCVYWNRSLTGIPWSPNGCELVSSNKTHTVCRAFHLSSFAILMALKDLPDVLALKVITYIGLSISLACLLLTIVTFATCQLVNDTRRTIHIHLCVSLLIADFVFLAGISQTRNRVLCGIIAGILHYSFLAVFAWMFLEGIQLYLMVQVVFVPKVPLKQYMLWVGYGLPALIVAISAAVNHEGYGTESACWLSTKNFFSCSFFMPALLISIINFIFLCKTLMTLKEKLSDVISEKKTLGKQRVFTMTAFGQLAILGCTWMFGGLYIQNATIPMMYIFTILNSFQGMYIFIMHCLMYKKVRDIYIRCFRKCLRKPYIWTPLSTSSSRTSNQGQRSVQETESTSGAVQ
ncbi:adhesion G protein-coupled receptor E3-like isoform X2 [Stegostoma tigrinum]|uniref:adhesion G protein-coupled receptor E3-like isoform X2 n=1 Tax=Stegostoma tigrinum TaxID=3053191 RepID=UPI00202ADC72|nr:adhesion G protein-coupled receptor E3-like isoform X2 [Stegostoma tigrinum]